MEQEKVEKNKMRDRKKICGISSSLISAFGSHKGP
jgi:hypothetical protein